MVVLLDKQYRHRGLGIPRHTFINYAESLRTYGDLAVCYGAVYFCMRIGLPITYVNRCHSGLYCTHCVMQDRINFKRNLPQLENML